MKKILLSILRDRNTSIAEFRRASEKLADILAAECAESLKVDETAVSTPMGETKGEALFGGVVLVPVLRAGLALLPSFLRYYPDARVGFIGLKRDEETVTPEMYYKNLPKISETDQVIFLEPMIATGGSLSKAVETLLQAGARQDQIAVASVIASKQGKSVIENLVPKAKLHLIQTDPELNSDSFIVPGLGDYGDRYFGTEESDIELKAF